MRWILAALALAALTPGCLPDTATPERAATDARPPDAATPTPDAEVPREDAAPDAAGDVDAAPPVDAAVEPPADAGPDAGPPPPDAFCPPPFVPEIERTCPGDEGCAPSEDTSLRVGASAREFSNLPFEKPRLEFLEQNDWCNEAYGEGATRCGELERDFLRNCGTDRLCPGDEGYVAPDADGSEKDVHEDGEPRYDYYLDCGFDDICPGDDGYRGRDEGEGDGYFDGLWLAGFGNNRPALGVRDPTWARTVAIEQGNTTITLTSVDTVGTFYTDVQRIRERARELLARDHPELDVDYIFVSSTHCHEVPDTMGQWAGDVDPEIDIPLHTGVNARYIANMREQTAISIVEALASLRPATMRVAEARTGADGFIRDSRDPVIINDQMGALRFSDADGNTIASVVNWGNHPEAMNDFNNWISGDFAHGIRQGMEEGVPAVYQDVPLVDEPADGLGGVSVYLQGAVGGLMTPLRVPVLDAEGTEVHNNTFLRADMMGLRLAKYALDALAGDDAVDVESPALSFTTSEFVIPVDNRVFHVGILVNLFDRESAWFDDTMPITECNIPHVRTQVAIIRLGPLTLYSVPGELFPELAIGGYDGSYSHGREIVKADNPNPPDLDAAPAAPYFHDLMPGTWRWTLGLGNDEIGYLVPEYDYKLHETAPFFSEAPGDHYEETNSLGPQAVPRIRAVLTLLAEHIRMVP